MREPVKCATATCSEPSIGTDKMDGLPSCKACAEGREMDLYPDPTTKSHLQHSKPKSTIDPPPHTV